MNIKLLSTLYRGIYVALVVAALVMDFGFPEGRADWYILNYYTILSNVLCAVFFAAMLLGGSSPRGEGAVVFCIAVTGLVYGFILGPADFTMGAESFFSFPNMVLHYVGPTMVVLDWLMFCPKGRIRVGDPLLWLCIPLAYFGYILVRSAFAGDIGATGSAFPYGFIDPAVQGGWGKMMSGVGVMALGMAVLGYLVFGVDRLMARK